LGLLLAVLAVTLNMIFIPKYGINGAAIATLISITIYSIAKLLFVVVKMKLFPFTKKTIVALIVFAVFFFAFYYWDFPFHPIASIVLKSILITVLYVWVNYQLKISEDFNGVVDALVLKLRR